MNDYDDDDDADLLADFAPAVGPDPDIIALYRDLVDTLVRAGDPDTDYPADAILASPLAETIAFAVLDVLVHHGLISFYSGGETLH